VDLRRMRRRGRRRHRIVITAKLLVTSP